MTSDPRFDRPDRRVMAICALRVLEEASVTAASVAVERTPSMRLALGWLVTAGIAKGWQVARFWRLLGAMEHCGGSTPHMHDYCRRRDFNDMLQHWKQAAGLVPPIHHVGGNPAGNWLRIPMNSTELDPLAIRSATAIPLPRVYALLDGRPPSAREMQSLAKLLQCEASELARGAPVDRKTNPVSP